MGISICIYGIYGNQSILWEHTHTHTHTHVLTLQEGVALGGRGGVTSGKESKAGGLTTICLELDDLVSENVGAKYMLNQLKRYTMCC